jgi:two-component system chemotaxis sensor kinase CheA
MATDSLEASFITETEDLLVQMEDGLLQLEERPDDKEILNAIFRAGHTVKGSAGLLKQQTIVGFTHVLENVLDRLRKDELPVDPLLISILLAGKDVIAGMVGCVADGAPVTTGALHARTLEALRGYSDLKALEAGQRAPATAMRVALEKPQTWRVELKLREDTFDHGQDPYLLLLELADLGELLQVEAHLDALPAFELLDVYRCHLSWTALLHTTATAERVMDVFLFVKEDAQLEVLPALDCTHWS